MRAAFALLILCVTACGKRGDPRPPIPVIPAATSDLNVRQQASKIILSWSFPALTTAGRSFSVKRIQIHREIEELDGPAGARPQFRSNDLLQTIFPQVSEKIDTIESHDLAAATTGSQLIYEDKVPEQSGRGRPVRYTYAVVTEGDTARSDQSNLASIIPLPVEQPPSFITASSRPKGISLQWAAGGLGVAYNVYRSPRGATPERWATPLVSLPIHQTQYDDHPPHGEYEYRLTTVSSVGPPLVESELSPPAIVTFKDVLPPPAPRSVTVLVETRITRLVWDSVEADDLAGYNVYRYEMSSRLKMTIYGLLKQVHFGDDSHELGITYTYAVTAVDTSGNESAETKSEPFLIPKTP